jgi:hypothetical protein
LAVDGADGCVPKLLSDAVSALDDVPVEPLVPVPPEPVLVPVTPAGDAETSQAAA